MTEPAPRVILIVLDGLRHSTARDTLGWLEGQVRAGRAHCAAINAELPAQSRPLYETILTGPHSRRAWRGEQRHRPPLDG